MSAEIYITSHDENSSQSGKYVVEAFSWCNYRFWHKSSRQFLFCGSVLTGKYISNDHAFEVFPRDNVWAFANNTNTFMVSALHSIFLRVQLCALRKILYGNVKKWVGGGGRDSNWNSRVASPDFLHRSKDFSGIIRNPGTRQRLGQVLSLGRKSGFRGKCVSSFRESTWVARAKWKWIARRRHLHLSSASQIWLDLA